MDLSKPKQTDWRRIFFIFLAATIILSLVLTACAPALDQPGGGGGGKGGGDKGGGDDNKEDSSPVGLFRF